jgi:hypothetical protein
MAWTATIKDKRIVDKQLLVNVLYDNGSINFNEVMDVTGSTIQSVSDRISSRLATLEATQTLIPLIPAGPFTPLGAQATPPVNVFLVALKSLRNAQEAVELGLITNADAAYTTALANAKAAFDSSFIGQF